MKKYVLLFCALLVSAFNGRRIESYQWKSDRWSGPAHAGCHSLFDQIKTSYSSPVKDSVFFLTPVNFGWPLLHWWFRFSADMEQSITVNGSGVTKPPAIDGKRAKSRWPQKWSFPHQHRPEKKIHKTPATISPVFLHGTTGTIPASFSALASNYRVWVCSYWM